jgi:uncharacterized protein (TIGR03382 family)
MLKNPFRRSPLAPALAVLLLAAAPAHADYMTQTMALNADGPPGVTGTVQIEAYDGNGAAGGGLSAGQVRLTFNTPAVTPPSGGSAFAGLQSVAFNTDLNLSPGQITTLATGWTFANNASIGSLGAFNWVSGTAGSLQDSVSVLISGLGANATPGHFMLPYQGNSIPAPPTPFLFGGQWVELSFDASGPHLASETLSTSTNSTPEPSSLALAGLGLAALFGRRKVMQAACMHAG